ncbi:MAG TPA: type IV pilus twitching motility protein PilT [Pseudobdellovibrionaceae bacterium]|nr:type IV pilus twitching motility protein PilT [Pseudobdellovibrionaceae bacterium]
MVSLLQLLKFATDQGASDLHIVAGSQPSLRVNGRIVRVKTETMTKEATRKLCYSVLSDSQKAKFEEEKELDFSFEVKNMARFRANLFFQRGAVSGVFRKVPVVMPRFADLTLPQAVGELTRLPHGLVLVTGPTGSGKSTTLASLVDKINQEQFGHIITLEDPIEFVHSHKNCIVNQREVGADTGSYTDAMKYLLRQDPDVALLGELRDLETIEAALITAETGHLVFATLHTNSAIATINRLVSVFPSDQQERVRVQLSFTLQAVLSQRLLPAIGGGRVVACEFLLMTPGIRNLIREGKLHQIESMMQVGQDKSGMITMNQSLVQLLLKRKISLETAFETSASADQLEKMMKHAGL